MGLPVTTDHRRASHHQASTAPNADSMDLRNHHHHHQTPPVNFLPINYVSPRVTRIERDLSELSLSDLLHLAKQLMYPCVTTLRLSVSAEDQLSVSTFFGGADQRIDDALFAFTNALAHAVEGRMQTLELGLCLSLRDINTLCPAIRASRTLKSLSFANSKLGDVTLVVLSSCLQDCQPLQTLNLSGCALTDTSAAAITAIVKGMEPSLCFMHLSQRKSLLGEHRAPKYGHHWRQNVILTGTWPPAPELGDNSRMPRVDLGHWQATLRKPMVVGGMCRKMKPTKATYIGGLIALDLSCNSFTDALSEELCPLLYKRSHLRALNLRCNKMTRAGAKPLLDVMKQLNILRLVDLRGNMDENLLGVLENGEHYTTFSTFQSPFWMDPESLDPIISNSVKSQSSTSSQLMPQEKKQQIKATTLRGGSCPPNKSAIKTELCTNTHGKRTKAPPKCKSPLRVNMIPSCCGASVSRTPPEVLSSRHKRYPRSHYSMEELNEVYNNNIKNNYLEARCTNLSPLQDHTMWNDVIAHGFGARMPRHTTIKLGCNRAQSAHDNILHNNNFYNNQEHRISPYRPNNTFPTSNFPSRLQPWPLTIYNQGSTSLRNGHSGRKLKLPIVWCHHRCKLLNDEQERERNMLQSMARCKLLKDVQEQEGSMCQTIGRGHLHERMMTMPPTVFHQLLPPKKGVPLPDDKREAEEWNEFVNQMTTSLLSLKGELQQLINPPKVVQHAKLNQMPRSFFWSGMLCLLERSCKLLNDHMMSITKRNKVKMQHMNVGTENKAPIVNGQILSSTKKKKKSWKVPTRHNVLHAKQEKVGARNFEPLDVHKIHRMIFHPNLPRRPWTTSKRNRHRSRNRHRLPH